MNITKLKYSGDTDNWVTITFDNHTMGSTSMTDGIRRQYTDIVQEYIDYGGVIERYMTDGELLVQTKQAKKQEVVDGFGNELSQGYTTNGLKMDSKYEDITKLKSGHSLAVQVGLTEMTIRDYNNVTHVAQVVDINTMLLELGSNYQVQLQKLWGYKDDIGNGTVIGEVEVIQWG